MMRVRTNNGRLTVTYSPLFVAPKLNPQATCRIFCLPYAGGMAEIYYPWLNVLPEEFELVAVQYPGHVPGTGDELYTCLNSLAEEIANEISAFSDKKYIIFGHSMGALIAYEVTKRLAGKKVRQPEHLFIAARTPPNLPVVAPMIHKMSDSEIIQIARAFNALPEEVLQNEDILQMIIPTLKADFEMIGTWKHDHNAPPLNVPLCAFTGMFDSLGVPEQMKEWSNYTSNSFRMITMPEKHYFILNPAVQEDIIHIIQDCIR
ncbi:alpha/beta fold hydrolase [Paenibacillus sp. FSL R7-0204]|uniref:thioesterase II family protein n=1 Tax=Paenibacillus sp. FSL R7-0204 TaxID=2921675 RepID=UPI0030F68509